MSVNTSAPRRRKTQACRTCSEEKPATTEYFYRATANVSGLTYRCKACQGDAQYRNKRTLDPGFIERDRQRAEAQARKACGVKQCSRCSEAKATTAEFWYLKPLKNGTTRPIQPCIVCTRSACLAAAHSSPIHLAWMERRAAKAKRLSDQLAAKLARKELTAVPPGMLWCGRCKAPRPQGDFSPSQRKKGTTVLWCRRCFREQARVATGGKPLQRHTYGAERFLCRKCGTEKPRTSDYFNKATANPDGLSVLCRECKKKGRVNESLDKKRAGNIRWKERNPERDAELKRAHIRRKMATSPSFRLSCSIKAGIVASLKRNGLRKSGTKWESLVGYTIDVLRVHLERQFLNDMNWGNFGRKGWHVDHIIAVSSFRFTCASDPEFKAAWALTNLRPLWGPENLSKGAKRLLLI